ncbi:hypothetical protein V8G54_027066, partial [Vigna mungo]
HDSKYFSRTFNSHTYNYYDYIEAWSKALYVHPGTHSWFIWFRRGISLKFPKYFIKWFSEFALLPSIFPSQVVEVYSHFREKTSFDSDYRLISIVGIRFITWIVD